MTPPNVNHKTGVRYGVALAQNHLLLMEEILDQGVNESLEMAINEALTTTDKLYEYVSEAFLIALYDDVKENIIQQWEEEEDEYSYTDENGNEFHLFWLSGAPHIQCMKTNRIVWVRSLCSPCVPNAGDLDNPFADKYLSGLRYNCYGVPEQYIEEDES
ncbi:hypothetical protein LCGC14_1416540 [marine sediment metagenome]|uniref:Uncharacterized protein n=1 Tax=marine sediment metagenome TaxID=412755 RepID=A0A0F9JT29_9ZZZZ